MAVMCVSCLQTGCTSPLEGNAQESLKRSVHASVERELKMMPQADPQLTRGAEDPLDEEFSVRRGELEKLGPQEADGGAGLDIGPALDGGDLPLAELSLANAIRTSVEFNLGVQQSRIEQGISAAEIIRAEAVFDAVLGAGLNFGRINEPATEPLIDFPGVVPQDTDLRQWGFTTDLSKRLSSGGGVELGFASENVANFTPTTSVENWDSNVSLGFSQPLLRGFGSDVNTAEIELARNTDRRAATQLRSDLLNLVVQVEQGYWNLVFARQRLVVAQWLVGEGERVRDILKSRRGFDTTLAQYADAVANVESRKTEVIEARRAIGEAMDLLKVLVNDPAMPVGGEIDLVPVDFMVDEPVVYSLRDSVMTALGRSPLIDLAVLSIDDASIREIVAHNGRLPQLDLAAEVSWLGLASSIGTSMNNINGNFVDYIMGLQFSQPIGNRAAESVFREARLGRSKAVIGYRQAVQQVLLDVKTAIRDLRADYALISQARNFRIAQAENLRSLEALQKTLAALTPEFLNLLFQRQDRLAQAQLQELQALVGYNIALANLQRVMGTGLEANNIDLVVVAPAGDSSSSEE